MSIAVAVIGAVAGFIGGFAKATAMSSEYSDTLWDLRQKSWNLDKQYELKTSQLKEAAADTIADNRAAIRNTQYVRDTNIGIAKGNVVDQQALADMQLAELQIQSAEAQGSATQDIALSGTRRMTATQDALGVKAGDTVNANALRTKTSADRSLEYSRAQAKLSTRQSVQQARESYINSTLAMESYRRQIDNTRSQLQRDLQALNLNYKQSKKELTDDIEYMESDAGYRRLAWNMISTILTGTSNGATAGMNLYSSGKQYNLWD